MRRLVLMLFFAWASSAFARGGSHSSHSSYTRSAKTVQVRSYTKKNGTVVQPHRRRQPGQKQADERMR